MPRDILAGLKTQPQGAYDENGSQYPMNEISHKRPSFLAEISSIQDGLRTYNDSVSRIADLHSRSLSNLDETVAQRNADQLQKLVDETNVLSNQLKARIKELQNTRSKEDDSHMHEQQISLVKQNFINAIRNYQQVEYQYRSKCKERIERQYKIVNPDATHEELSAVVNSDQGDQIFIQALQSPTRYGDSSAAYHEVQKRHEDILKIGRTLEELTQLLNEMSYLVEQQDETLDYIEQKGDDVEKAVKGGLDDTIKAVKSARSARKKRWICFIIVLIILAIIAIVLGVKFGGDGKK